MERTQLLQHIRDTLGKAGFCVSDHYFMRLVGFDLVARRDNTLLIIKVLTNIDALSEAVARELKTLASLLQGSPILIGERNGVTTLEDSVVYFRFGMQAITLPTLEKHFLEGNPIMAYAAPGGPYVNLDENKLKQLRQEQQISLGTFARFVRVSRRTAQLYEEGMNARIEIASRIEQLLGSTITTPIDLLYSPFEPHHDIDSTHLSENMKAFQKEIFSLMEHVGYNIIPMERCPFEAVSKQKNHIILTCAHKYDKKLIRRVQVVSSISRITEKRAVVFTDKNASRKNIEGTPVIVKEELEKISEPEEILDLIIERTENTP